MGYHETGSRGLPWKDTLRTTKFGKKAQKRRHSRLFWTALLLLGSSLPGYAGEMLSAPEIKARVVDGHTGAPIEGAVVVLSWKSSQGELPRQDQVLGHVELIETTTDSSGYFRSPAWGPKDNPFPGHVRKGDPSILVLKAGYDPILASNRTLHAPNFKYSRTELRSVWHGRSIAIMPAPRSTKPSIGPLSLLERQMRAGDREASLEDWSAAPCALVMGAAWGEALAANGLSGKDIPYSLRLDPGLPDALNACADRRRLESEVAEITDIWSMDERQIANALGPGNVKAAIRIVLLQETCSKKYPQLAEDIQGAYARWLENRGISHEKALEHYIEDPAYSDSIRSMGLTPDSPAFQEELMEPKCAALSGDIIFHTTPATGAQQRAGMQPGQSGAKRQPKVGEELCPEAIPDFDPSPHMGCPPDKCARVYGCRISIRGNDLILEVNSDAEPCLGKYIAIRDFLPDPHRGDNRLKADLEYAIKYQKGLKLLFSPDCSLEGYYIDRRM